MVLKNTLNGDKIPICRVEDLEITLVSPDLAVRVRLPTKGEQQWRSLSEVRAAEIQCMQLSLALLARHESEMYVTIEADKSTANYLQTNSNPEQRTTKSRQSSEAVKKHLEECEKVFSPNTKSKSKPNDDSHSYYSPEKLSKSLSISGKNLPHQHSIQYQESPTGTKEEPSKSSKSSHAPSDKLYRTADTRPTKDEPVDSYNRSHRPLARQSSLASSSGNYKTKTNTN
jgi:hypothetical protein